MFPPPDWCQRPEPSLPTQIVEADPKWLSRSPAKTTVFGALLRIESFCFPYLQEGMYIQAYFPLV